MKMIKIIKKIWAASGTQGRPRTQQDPRGDKKVNSTLETAIR